MDWLNQSLLMHIEFFFRFFVKINKFFVFTIYFLIMTIKWGFPLMTIDRKQVIFTVKSLNLWPIRAVKAQTGKGTLNGFWPQENNLSFFSLVRPTSCIPGSLYTWFRDFFRMAKININLPASVRGGGARGRKRAIPHTASEMYLLSS